MIVITMLGLPPSSNKAYWNSGSGRVLTKAGKSYKAEVTNYIVKNHAHQTRELRKDATIGLLVAFGFDNLFNAGWPKKADWRYKKQDLDNRYKLLQDAIVEATSMDDSQICFDFKYKYLAEEPLTTIYIWNEDDTPFGQQLVFGSFPKIVGGTREV